MATAAATKLLSPRTSVKGDLMTEARVRVAPVRKVREEVLMWELGPWLAVLVGL